VGTMAVVVPEVAVEDAK
jgi:hypothetical protein